MIGIMVGNHIKPSIGLGDGLQFSSLPENYFRHTGKKLHDISRAWFFDHNTFVDRSDNVSISKKVELWNFSHRNVFPWPNPRILKKERGDWKIPQPGPSVYLSNAEIWASVLDVPVVLSRPRLYRWEDFPYEKREKILLQTEGRSHGKISDDIISHVVKKYLPTGNLYHIGTGSVVGVPHIDTPSLWNLAELISSAKMFIGPDSGPSWISSCYSDVITKIIRTKPNPPDEFKKWVPLDQGNIHSFWDDRCRMTYNVTENDIGFTWSYLKI